MLGEVFAMKVYTFKCEVLEDIMQKSFKPR